MSGQEIAQFIPLILIFVIFYFFLIRPQQKGKRSQTMVESLKRGDEIITSGGIIGVVDRIMEDDRIELLWARALKFRLYDQQSQVC